MKFHILTLFPDMFDKVFNQSMLWKAQDRGLVEFKTIDLRQFGLGPRHQVDDTPYGGGDGMLLKPEPIFAAVEFAKEKCPNAKFFLFSDDADYVREKFKGDEFEVIDWNHGRDSFYDMMLMSHCKHNICANSTFSFWGARLNPNEEKMMVRPTIHKNSQKFVADEMKDMPEDASLNCLMT